LEELGRGEESLEGGDRREGCEEGHNLARVSPNVVNRQARRKIGTVKWIAHRMRGGVAFGTVII
jgi:hypothetical protein